MAALLSSLYFSSQDLTRFLIVNTSPSLAAYKNEVKILQATCKMNQLKFLPVFSDKETPYGNFHKIWIKFNLEVNKFYLSGLEAICQTSLMPEDTNPLPLEGTFLTGVFFSFQQI